uniref:Ephrin RBD domain-containing protein n=1 Tax=Angiostrongylus cantonensis TaxID=6313 RepID=A0A0K0DJS2_ANGCA
MVRFGILLTVCSFFIVNAEQEQYDVYWNSSNPLFEPFDNAIDSPGYYELAARPLDIINFHCPRRKAKEYSLIHKVSFEEFQRCSLGATAELVGSCDATSSGKKDGLFVRRLGLCNEKNMRMAVVFGTEAVIERRDPILGTDVDLQELMQNRFYLAEENGELNWKKNVLPDVGQ